MGATIDGWELRLRVSVLAEEREHQTGMKDADASGEVLCQGVNKR